MNMTTQNFRTRMSFLKDELQSLFPEIKPSKSVEKDVPNMRSQSQNDHRPQSSISNKFTDSLMT